MRDVSRGEHWFDFVMRRKDAAGNPFLLVGRPGHSYGICCFGGDGHVSLSLSMNYAIMPLAILVVLREDKTLTSI